jgi:hypothetical protein
MNTKTSIIAVLIAGFLIYSHQSNSWINYDKSVTVSKLPVQVETTKASFEYKGFTITPLAAFQIEARLLSKRKYFLGNEAKLAPVDYALGWGPMSNFNILKELDISQSNRWYFYQYKTPPILPNDIIAHSGNMHLIPATQTVARKIKSVRRGEIILLKGYLVNVSSQKGWHWLSSLSRTDTGSGSCEVVWVEELKKM